MKGGIILLSVLALGHAFTTSPQVPICKKGVGMMNTKTSSSTSSLRQSTIQSRAQKLNMMTPIDSPTFFADTTTVLLSEKEMGSIIGGALFFFSVTGGMIPATISANKAMFKALSGRKDNAVGDEANVEKSSIDPTIMEGKYRTYVTDSGAAGPELPFSSLLFASDPIPIADIAAVLGRIQNVDTIVDWKNLPSTKLPKVSETNPPMWLPRKAFKVLIRKAKFVSWPVDSKTGRPIGGEELRDAELSRISKSNALIGDAAIDAVFDSWAWGASVATPDKVLRTLNSFTTSSTGNTNEEIDFGSFIGATIRGRSLTALASLTFILIQLLAYGVVILGPVFRFFFGDGDVDIGL